MAGVAKPGEIADPVHRYIRFTSIERDIIDHRVTQRLRHIGQTGLAHLVYPEMRSSRFSHSLGVMHFASQFLASSLQNARPDIRDELLDVLDQMVNQATNRYGLRDEDLRLLENEPLETSHDTVREKCPGIVLIEQALRLAALFHDLGHLPFSHDFETALEGIAHEPSAGGVLPSELFMLDEAAGKLHERLGRRLSELLLYEISDNMSAAKLNTISIAFSLAQDIFDSKKAGASPVGAAIRWLHTLIDGELDVDRCDYILRDGRNYAFEFANIDMERLVGNLTVTKEGDEYVVAILPHGLSAVEDFLLARYRSYQHGVRHHKVTQVGAALQHCIAQVIQHPNHPILINQFKADLQTLAKAGTSDAAHKEFDDRFKKKDERSKFLDRFAGYDDVWWTGILREHTPRDEWFELVCSRQANPRTLIKWAGDFPEGMDITEWNKILPKKVKPTSTLEEREKSLAVAKAWSAELLRLKNKEGVLIIRHKFQPWESDNDNKGEDSNLSVLKKDGRLQPVTKLSPLIRSLRSAWSEELQVLAFAPSSCNMNAEQVYKSLENAIRGAQEDAKPGAQEEENKS